MSDTAGHLETNLATRVNGTKGGAGMAFRCIGPHRGGRVVAVAGHPHDPMVFYFGACAGGVWKTVDGGTFWECVTDGFFQTAAVGALAVAESDPNVLYAGTGETTIRGNVSHGDGVYRSTDAGATWTNMGLAGTRHIAKIRVHPRNPDLVYVAALGHAWGPNEERGLFRSADGGLNWERILYRTDRAGAIDLAMDATNPRILYCAFWEAQRTPYGFTSGGPGSSLYRSNDGGDSWTEITCNEGLPAGLLGKIGVASSPARSGRVWALIEAEDGGLFRSDDGGEHWKCVSDSADLRRRAWYYMHIFADPQDENTVYVLNVGAWKSIDGGATFSPMPTPHADNHDLWIDPANPLRMIEGHDGGACVSFNGGIAWSTVLNQPTAQFYHVIADSRTPYRLYGSQQDNTALSVPSQSPYGAITEADWFVPGGGESGYIAVRPDNPDIQYAGDHKGRITRHDRRSAQQRLIDLWPNITGMYEGAESQKYRVNWTAPIFLSPFDPNVLYTAANCLFRSSDEGANWEAISPDLTRNDPSTLGPAGGELTRDNTSAEFYGTIFAAVESPHQRGTLWVGSDDGLVHLSRDGGKNWQEVTPPPLKAPDGEWALISIIEVSPHDAATAYLAATRYKLDDTRPYLYKTSDYGASWTAITNGIPDGEFTRVIREDPRCRGLLYAGTETGLYISIDDGEHWERFQNNLPICPIHDLILHNGDLIIGTHGRGFWILDDIAPLHEMARDPERRTRLFGPSPAIRFKIYEGFGGGEGSDILYRMAGAITYAYRQEKRPDGTEGPRLLNAGQNPINGVPFTYELAELPAGEITFTILDTQGGEIRRFSSKRPAGLEGGKPGAVPEDVTPEGSEGLDVAADPLADEEAQTPFLPKEVGINRFTWNFRAANATKLPADKFSEFATAGPAVPPGTYTARLEVGKESFEVAFQILPDPRVDATQEAFQAQYDLGLKIRDTMSRLNEAILQLRDVREQIQGWEPRLARLANASEALTTARDLITRLTAVEEEFMNTKSASRMMYPPPNVPTRLNQRLAYLGGAVASADAAPTAAEYGVYDELSAQIEEQLDVLATLVEQDIAKFNDAVRALEAPAVVMK